MNFATSRNDVSESLVRHIEAVGRLWQARVELTVRSWGAVLEAAQRRTEDWTHGETPQDEEIVAAVERSLHRMSRFVPGATCIHRSLAAQRMLLRRGHAARVVVGLRRGESGVEGHAWVEIGGDQGRQATLFFRDEAGFRPIL